MTAENGPEGTDKRVCAACSAPLAPQTGRGRPRKWCPGCVPRGRAGVKAWRRLNPRPKVMELSRRVGKVVGYPPRSALAIRDSLGWRHPK
jgi:hypothetical protein